MSKLEERRKTQEKNNKKGAKILIVGVVIFIALLFIITPSAKEEACNCVKLWYGEKYTLTSAQYTEMLRCKSKYVLIHEARNKCNE